jgi:ABC-2 type transport system ATP-binding protein
MHFKLTDIHYKYRSGTNFCLKNISLDFSSGGVIGLAGANGSGKTTLIRIILRQLVDYSGSYTIDSREENDISANFCSQYRIGYAPDNPILDDTLTGYEILRIICDLRLIKKEQFEYEMKLFCDWLQVDEWMRSQPCNEYSHGMRKKISIMCACLGNCRFIVLDEPLNNLDPIAIIGVQKLILYKKKNGTGTLISSHILNFIEKNADNVALMKKGNILYFGPLSNLRDKHDHASLEDVYMKLFQM